MQKLREQYGEYLCVHKDSGMKLSPIAFQEIDAWHQELRRLEAKKAGADIDLDDFELRRKPDVIREIGHGC